jgi:hypothetical protein
LIALNSCTNDIEFKISFHFNNETSLNRRNALFELLNPFEPIRTKESDNENGEDVEGGEKF